MMQENEFFDGIAGGSDLPEEERGVFLELEGLVVSSTPDKHIARLLIRHPEVQVKFRSNNLANLDANTKQALLEDIQTAVGIVPLRN